MKIGIIGKFPPIQGGVSMRTYWAAHGLAKLGHSVHVITNAREAGGAQRMYMREEDWTRCEGSYGEGFVKVHWTQDYGARQMHVPASTPYVTKLASIGIALAGSGAIEAVYSHYLEPYGVAGHVVAQATGLPHVTRTAGSDAGRLWSLPQFADMYNTVFRCADAVIAGPSVADKLTEANLCPRRFARDGQRVRMEDVFTPEGPVLDVEMLRRQLAEDPVFGTRLFGPYDPSLRYFGVYGKIGKTKGTYALLDALARMRARGLRVGLLALAHDPSGDIAFRQEVKARHLEEVVCQLPFLPHWRVPEFIRRCIAVCCLEQDFPIRFHNPVVAREILSCGACLVASTEMIQKLPSAHRLVDGYNCIAVPDVNDIAALEEKLTAIHDNPHRIAELRSRARDYGVRLDNENTFPSRLASILEDVIAADAREPSRKRPVRAPAETSAMQARDDRGTEAREPFAFLRSSLSALSFDEQLASLAAIQSAKDGPARHMLEALRCDLLAQEMQARRQQQTNAENKRAPSLFRLHAAPFFEDDLFESMVPKACGEHILLEFDVAPYVDDPVIASALHRRRKWRRAKAAGLRACAVIPCMRTQKIRIIDPLDVALLKLCDGSMPVRDVCRHDSIEMVVRETGTERANLSKRVLDLFEAALIELTQPISASHDIPRARQA